MRAVLQGRVQMRDVKVKKEVLLEAVTKNRLTHIAEYESAVIGYKEEAVKEIDRAMGKLKRQVEELQGGDVMRLVAVAFDLKVPENHEKDYDQVIAMLVMCVDDELTIRSDEFACYVMDNWDWKQDFLHTNRRYSK